MTVQTQHHDHHLHDWAVISNAPLRHGFASSNPLPLRSPSQYSSPPTAYWIPYSGTMDFVCPYGPLPHIPDDVTIPQFLLDSWHPIRPVKKELTPWFIEDATGRGITSEEIRARVFGLANELKSRWNERKTSSAFSAPITSVRVTLHYPVAIWAIHRLGGIATTANPSYTADELLHQLKLTKASILFTHSASLAPAEQAARDAGIPPERVVLIDSLTDNRTSHITLESLVHAGLSKHPLFVERQLRPGEGKTKIALLCFSSGTTGRPKAVAIPHRSLISNCIEMAFHGRVNTDYAPKGKQRYEPGQVAIAVLPFYHIYGLVVNLHFTLFHGATLVIVPKFNLSDMLKSIERYRINHLFLVPPMMVLMCKVAFPFQSSFITMVMSGAAPLSAELTRQFVEVLPQAHVGQGYGMTETCTAVTWPRVDQKIGTLGSGGQLLPGNVARILKQDGTYANFNEPGELIIKGPSMALCYLDNPEATNETFLRFEGDPDLWVRTGDEVMFNEEMEIFVLDRIKEIMKVRGFQVAPAELEGLLLDHPDVDDACVVGVPDEYSGELPMAFIVLSQNALGRIKKGGESEVAKVKEGISKYVADNKVYYKRLAGGIEFVDAIPKNPSGKLLRRFLRDKAKQMKAAASGSATKPKL
ncbi:hypothetical protein NM688_g2238 [Phlebia brevispora]|uniref:Uncharacterized protein n=1 Tax=Phlebia brevispora TaxID=194682 RepID=A0ACC1T944_9APHY|nr:hypothetical protein NM688_g2238 [Phlebia brevispora]